MSFGRSIGHKRAPQSNRYADYSGNGRHGTLVGTPAPASVLSPWSGFDYAAQFPTTTAYIDCGSTGFSIQVLTLDARVRYSTTLPSASGQFNGIAGRYVATGAYVLYVRGTSDNVTTPSGLRNAQNKFVFGVARSDGGQTALVSSTVVAVGGSYIVRGTIDAAGFARLYVNGVLEDSGTIGVPGTAAAAFRIGALSFGGSACIGQIVDEVRVSNIVRTTAASYSVETTPFSTDANTVALYHL